MKKILVIGILLCLVVLISGCTGSQTVTPSTGNSQSNVKVPSSVSSEEFKSSCHLITYDDLARYTSTYAGDNVKFSGEITQVTGQGTVILIDMSLPGEYSLNSVWLDYSGSSTFLEGDQINVYGTVVGTKTYTTVMGASRSIPEVKTKYIELSNGNEIVVTPKPQTLSFSGSGTKTVNKFHLDAGLAIFKTHQSDSTSYTGATLKDDQGNYVDLVANLYDESDTSSSTHISKSGDYILDVSSSCSWTITVTQ